MLPIADITIDQLLHPPLNRFCDISNHRAPEFWIPNPETKEQKLVRFFKIKHSNPLLNNKNICELCMIIANYQAELIKEKKNG
jgi:hypothetical protein